MFHSRVQAGQAADPCPRSAVSAGSGWAGLLGVVGWLAVAKAWRLDGPYGALVGIAACGLPMVLWSLLVDRTYRSASAGLDWSRTGRGAGDVSLTKLAGLWATWAAIALIYATVRFYWQAPYDFAMWCLMWSAPALVVLSVPYVLWIDRYLVEPRDGAWHLGAWMTGQAGWSGAAIEGHLRGWAVKGFFLAFMLAIVPGGFGELIRSDWHAAAGDPVRLATLLVTFMFVVDVAFACVGYVLTFRALDAHIRSANPYAAAWTAALICYPPFTLMGGGGALDYHPGTADWAWWSAGHPVLQGLVGAVLVGLTGVYAWSTVAFGPRFSNLTNRGVLTHGPYRWSRHPAYLSKNLFWWVSTVPVLTTGSLVDAARATLLLGAVGGVYWWRAKTEERHLRADPDYVAYDAWMARHGVVPRMFRWVRGR